MKRPKGPSARCPKCRKRVAIRKSDGLFRLHGYMPGDDNSAACPGSGKADPTPRARCPRCGRLVRRRADGTLYDHERHGEDGDIYCA